MEVVYPGSFDPITYGHLDILERALALFDRIRVAVAENPQKFPLFTLSERVEIVRAVLEEHFSPEEFSHLIVDGFSGLLVDYLKTSGIRIVLRGLRAVSDYEYELQLAHMNKILYPDVDTVFLVASPQYSFLSSSLVKEIISLNGDTSSMVPVRVARALRERLQKATP